jgi:hypothetical protein
MHKKQISLFVIAFIIISGSSKALMAEQPKIVRRAQPFGKMQPRKPLFVIKDDKESLPIRPVIKLTEQYHKLRNIKVIALLRSKQWTSAESFFDVLAYKTDQELLLDKKLIKECGERFGLKLGSYALKKPISPENCIRVIELKPTPTVKPKSSKKVVKS